MGGSIDTLAVSFHEQTALWFTNLQPVALGLLGSLWTISLAWKLVPIVLQGGKVELGDILTELVRSIMLFGGVLYLILNADWLVSILLESAMTLANVATGTPAIVSPGAFLDRGVGIGQDIMARSGIGLMVFSSLATLLIVGAFAAIAAFSLACLAEFYITAGIGSVFLGFAGTPWTSEIAKRYVMQVGGAAAKLLGLYLILGFADQILAAWVLEPAGPGEEPADLTFAQVLRLFGIVLVIVFLAFVIPAIMHGLVGGASVGAMSPLAMMQASMQATTALAGAAIRGGAAVQAAGGLSAAQMGAGSVGGAIRGAMANAPAAPGSLTPSAGSQAVAGLGAVGEVAGRTTKNLAAGLYGNVTGQLLGQGSTAGTIHAMRESMVQGLSLSGGDAAAAPPERPPDKPYLGQRGD